jgi:hypothetical protein
MRETEVGKRPFASYTGETSYWPVSVNTAGVDMPVAVALI